MRKGLFIWIAMLALACTMSFATVLSFADELDTPSDDPVVTDDQTVADAPEDVDVDQADVVANATELGDSSAWVIECPATADFNDGNPVEPPVSVTMNGSDVPSSYYTVTYSNNTAVTKSAGYTVATNPGGTVVKSGTFAIVYPMSKYAKVTLSKTSLPVKFKKNDSWKVIPVAQKPTVTVTGYSGAALKEGTDYTVAFSNANSKNAGTYSVTVTAKSNSDYTGSLTAQYKITPIKIDGADFYVYGTARYYTGKKLKPKKVMIGYYNAAANSDMDLVKGTHYTVTKAAVFSNNKKIGAGNIKITIQGKGNFTGTEQLFGTFEIGPEKATVKSAKAGKKKATFKWKKSNHADGYRIEYFGWKGNKTTKTKVVYVKSKKTVKKTIKNLKSGYTYDFWISSYKTVKGVKRFVYGNPKTLKIK